MPPKKSAPKEKIVVVNTPAASKPKKNKNKNMPSKKRAKQSVSIPKASSFGEDLGGLVGKGVTAMSKWLGFGAYTVKNNSIIGAGGTIPSMHSTRDSVIVRHREYVGDIISSTTFISTSISANPGLTSSFPWLAKLASAFQQYKILGMVAEYIPEVSEIAAAEISLGFVCLAADYRTDLPSYPSLNQALESEFAVSVKPNCPVALAIECNPAMSPYNVWFVRTGPVPTGSDIKLFDFVEVDVLVGNNQTGGIVLGQLWFTFEIELLRPTAFLDPPATTFYARFSAIPTNAAPMNGAVLRSYTNPFGTNVIGGTIAINAANDGMSVTNPGLGVVNVVLPRGATGSYTAFYDVLGSNSTCVFPSVFTVTNGTGQGIIGNGSFADTSCPVISAAAEPTVMFIAFFSISDAQAALGQCLIAFGNSTVLLPIPGAADLIVTQTTSSTS